MSIASEISRLQGAKADIKAAIEAKGVSVPSAALLDTYDTYVAQISGGGGNNPQFFSMLRGNAALYYNTGIILGSSPFVIETTAGSLGTLRSEEVIFSTWRNNTDGFNLFFTGSGNSRRVDFFINGHNYLAAGGWYTYYAVKLEYDGAGTYTLTVGNNSVTISSTVVSPTNALKLFCRGDGNSSTISDSLLGATTIKYGANLENTATYKPCIYNGVAGMWKEEIADLAAVTGSSGAFLLEV